MYTMKIAILAVATLAMCGILATSLPHCPASCSCVPDLTIMHINCSALHLKKVPKIPQPNLQITLTIAFNKIVTLSHIDLNSYILIDLNASHNHIETLRFPFDGQKHLRSVDLSHNRIKQFNYLVFTHVSTSLRLGYNPLDMSLCTTPFISSDTIIALDLSGANLTYLGHACFSEMAALTTLDLSWNPLATLDPRVLLNLTSVNLRGTPIQDVVDRVNELTSPSPSGLGSAHESDGTTRDGKMEAELSSPSTSGLGTAQESESDGTTRSSTMETVDLIVNCTERVRKTVYFVLYSGTTVVVILILIFSYLVFLNMNYLNAPQWLFNVIVRNAQHVIARQAPGAAVQRGEENPILYPELPQSE